jgi:hypothetical protein
MQAAEQGRSRSPRSEERRSLRHAGAWPRRALTGALLAALGCSPGSVGTPRETVWSADWADFGGSTPYAYGASSPRPTRLDLWAASADGKLWLRTDAARSWRDAGSLPGGARIAGAPAAVFRGGDTTDVLVRDDAGALWTSAWTNTSAPAMPAWTGWTLASPAAAGHTTFDPALTAIPAQNRVDLWAIDGNNAVSHISRRGDAWSGGWTPLGTPPGKVPVGIGAAARPSLGVAIDLVVAASDGTVWHGKWDETHGALSWDAIDGIASTDGHPSVSSSSSGTFSVWVTATDGAMHSRTFSDGTSAWTPAEGWTYVGGPATGSFSGPTALFRNADADRGTDLIVRGRAGQAEHKLWYDDAPAASMTSVATPPASLALLESDGVHPTPLWESVALAVPPAAACPNGRLIIAGSREIVAPGKGDARVWTADLGAVAAGGKIALPLVTLPSTGDPGDFFAESDDALALLPDGTVLLDLHVGHSDTSTQPPYRNPRGVELFYTSSDCGAHWLYKGRLDPANSAYANAAYAALGDWGDVWPCAGNDRPELYVDPWGDPMGRTRVYVTADACVQGAPGMPPKSMPLMTSELLFYGLWDPGAQEFVPQPCSGGRAPFCLLQQGTPPLSPIPFAPDMAMTSLPGGTLYMFSCEGRDAVLRSFSTAAANPTLSPRMLLNPGGVDSVKCGKVASSRPLEGSLSITRVGSYAEGDMLRVTWPGVDATGGASRQLLNIAYVVVSGDTFTVTSSTQIAPAEAAGSVLQASVVEMSVAATTFASGYGITSPPPDLLNAALLYYYSTSTTPADGADGDGWGETLPAMVLLRDENVSAVSHLGAPFRGFSLPGDYQHGSAFFDVTTNKMTCVTLWTDTSAWVLHANIVTIDP